MSSTMALVLNLLSIITNALAFVLPLWWLALPFVLFPFAWHLWIKYKRGQFVQNMKWVLLEIKPPRELIKTPLSMEQVFAGLHGIRSSPNWAEIHMQGVTQAWFSMEMVSTGGAIHFYVRTLEALRNLVEANIYAQYPETEISQVNDYVHDVPPFMPEGEYDVWGTELVLVKDDAYPIRTYREFIGRDATLEEQRVDPIASMLEIMAKLSRHEHIWVQTLIRPVDSSWHKTGEKLRDDLIGRKETPKQGIIKGEAQAMMHELKSAAGAMLSGEAASPLEEKPQDDKQSALLWMTKGEGDVVKAVEDNISKIGFDTVIRFVYTGKKDSFSKANVAAVMGAFKQFSTQNLNGLKPSVAVTTSAVDYAWQMEKTRSAYRKKRVLADYKKRFLPQHSTVTDYLKPFIFERLPVLHWFFMRSQPFIFNIEELATVYHFPSLVAKAPLTPRVEAKKGEPPAGLPTG